jgi:HEPN domain-containing protein
MKQITKDWLTLAAEDLHAAKALAKEEGITNLASFHCQQCLEKSLKASIEEQNKTSVKSHDLIRLLTFADIKLSEEDFRLLSVLNEIYIDSRYPGDIGLLPSGKPTHQELQSFINFTEKLFLLIKIDTEV